jgi:hypothetical protein
MVGLSGGLFEIARRCLALDLYAQFRFEGGFNMKIGGNWISRDLFPDPR